MNTSFIKKQVAGLFESVDESFFNEFLLNAEIVEHNIGSYIFHQDSTEKVLYIILTGRVRIIKKDNKGFSILGDVASGQPLGEFSFFSDEPRTASAVAMRKTSLLKLKESDYITLIQSYPNIGQKFSAFVYNRLKSNFAGLNKINAPKNISVIILNHFENYDKLIDQILIELNFSGIATNVYYHDSFANKENSNVLNKIDEHEGINFLVCDETDMEWSSHCLMYSDSIIIASDFNSSKELLPIEKSLKIYESSILNQKKYLLLVHSNNAKLPVRTFEWLESRNVDLHIHLRQNNGKDLRRFCRIITHRAVGLTLGGGGTKGFAHLGAVRALSEAGIEIDFIGGTSAGALYGMIMGLIDFDFEKALEISMYSDKMKTLSTKLTFPIISLLSSKRITNFLKEIFGEADLEDIWYNSYCVSTNYTDSILHIHNKGKAWKQISASIALPGIFPPVIINNKIHIDGGVMDNLPIDNMTTYPVSQIIAIALSPMKTEELKIDELPTIWALLWDKMRGKKLYDLPGIPTLLVTTGLINSRQKQMQTNSGASLYLELDLEGIKMLDGSKWKEMIEMGYQQMKVYLVNKNTENPNTVRENLSLSPF